jgi:sporulation related protein
MTERRDEDVESGFHHFDDDAPRSIFPSLWISVSLVLALLGGMAVFAAPYLRHSTAARPDSQARTSTTASVDVKRESTPPPSAAQPEPAQRIEPKRIEPKTIEPKARESKTIAPTVTPPPEQTTTERRHVKGERKRDAVTAARPDAKTVIGKTDTKPQPKRLVARGEAPAVPSARNDALVRQREQERVVAVRTPAHEGTHRDDVARRTGDDSATDTPASASGDYWVQVAAVKDADAARRLTAQLRAHSFRVDELTSTSGAEREHAPSAPVASSGEQYEVFVSGTSASELTPKLASKGLAASAVPEGSVVTPRLPLPDAVALAKSLGAQGLRVQVKRRTTATAERRESERRAGDGSRPLPVDKLYRIRVGTFADRASADAAVRRLHGLGYERAFVARAGQ